MRSQAVPFGDRCIWHPTDRDFKQHQRGNILPKLLGEFSEVFFAHTLRRKRDSLNKTKKVLDPSSAFYAQIARGVPARKM